MHIYYNITILLLQVKHAQILKFVRGNKDLLLQLEISSAIINVQKFKSIIPSYMVSVINTDNKMTTLAYIGRII